MGLRVVPPGPCPRCGGEVRVHLEVDVPAIIRTCSACPDRKETAFRPSPPAREILAEVVAARVARGANLRPSRPVTLLWIPWARGEEATREERAHIDTAVMIRERLVSPDPLVFLRTEPYPSDPEDFLPGPNGLADYTLLVARDPAACSRALALLGPAIPLARSVVFATPESTAGGPLPRHERLKTLSERDAAPGGLFDEICHTLSWIRRAAIWCELDPHSTRSDPLFREGPRTARMMAFTDDLCAYLLALVDRLPPSRPEELLEAAGAREIFAPRLHLLGIGGFVEVWPDLVRLGAAGMEALGDIVPARPDGRTAGSTLALLFEEAQEGGRRARQRLLKEGGELAHRIARQRLGSVLRARLDSQDISQSVIKDLLRDLGDFEYRGEPAWRAYLRRLVESKILAKADYYRAARRDVRREEALDLSAGEPPEDSPGPAETAEKTEEYERLARALERLGEEERQVLVLRVFEGLGHREIARRLGRPGEGSIHKLYARALAHLAGVMEQKE